MTSIHHIMGVCLLAACYCAHAEVVKPVARPAASAGLLASSATVPVSRLLVPSRISVPMLEIHADNPSPPATGTQVSVLVADPSPTAAPAIVFTVPVLVENLKSPNNQLMVSCGVAAQGGAQKGLTKQILNLYQGRYNGTLKIQVVQGDPHKPFAKGDTWLCNLNAGNGWANPLNDYLAPDNKPIAGKPLRTWASGSL